jgi:hypothetical protein
MRGRVRRWKSWGSPPPLCHPICVDDRRYPRTMTLLDEAGNSVVSPRPCPHQRKHTTPHTTGHCHSATPETQEHEMLGRSYPRVAICRIRQLSAPQCLLYWGQNGLTMDGLGQRDMSASGARLQVTWQISGTRQAACMGCLHKVRAESPGCWRSAVAFWSAGGHQSAALMVGEGV